MSKMESPRRTTWFIHDLRRCRGHTMTGRQSGLLHPAAQRPRAPRTGSQCHAGSSPVGELPGNGRSIIAHPDGQGISNFSHASRARCGEGLCENPKFANRVPTSTPRAWGAHADRPHFLLPPMPFLGLAPHRPEFLHSLVSCWAALWVARAQ